MWNMCEGEEGDRRVPGCLQEQLLAGRQGGCWGESPHHLLTSPHAHLLTSSPAHRTWGKRSAWCKKIGPWPSDCA